MAKNNAASKREAQEFSRSFYRDSEVELRDLYDEIAYTIIDDVLSTERLPGIYRRLTT